MQLETEQNKWNDISEETIREAFADDSVRGSFIILSQTDQYYMQASGYGDGPYTLEYREGGDSQHFQAADELSKDAIQEVFLKYFNGDESWRSDYQWQLLSEVEYSSPFASVSDEAETKPWWKFW